jgi:uncharacterized protein YkwD
MAALAAGCGGGSGRSGDRPAANHSPSQGPAAAASPQVTDGRLGEAVVARPGSTVVRGHVRRIPPATALAPSHRKALGAEADCQDTEVQPTAANLAHVSDVILCLMNAMRANAGLPALKQSQLLAKASVGHSQDMVDNKYFAHDSLDGRDLVARLKAVAYIPVDAEWIVGENLVWGSGAMATPRALVDAWMNSTPHRENLLSGDFAEVGMGPALGVPSDEADDGITVTTDFGTRFTGSLPAADAAAPSSASHRARALVTRTRAARRRAALRRCTKRRGVARRRCVRAARRLR